MQSLPWTEDSADHRLKISAVERLHRRLLVRCPAVLATPQFAPPHNRVVQNTEKFTKFNEHFTPHFYHPNDHPRLFRYPLQASSTSRARCPIFAITAQYGALCLYCLRCCPLLTAHHRHHTDTPASQCSLVAWQVGLGPSLTIMPTSSSPSHWSRITRVTANVSPTL